MVPVLDANKKPLAPCHEARARKLLSKGKAAVYLRYPFTIILKRVVNDEVEPCTIKIDPGSQHTGISIVRGQDVLFMAQIDHRTTIKDAMKKRAAYRRNRRSRKLRYREPRFLNRTKPEGWLPPSVRSPLQNTVTMVKRLNRLFPIGSIEYQLVKFDTQKLVNRDIAGVEYQQGPLYRTDIRSFLCKTYQNTCQYCGGATGDRQMEWEHLLPRSRGGSNSVSNATWACHTCNQEKGNLTPQEWASVIKAKKTRSPLDEARLSGIKKVQKQNYGPALADAAKVNSIRLALKTQLEQETGLPVRTSAAYNTKVNRVRLGLEKDHCIDAACVGREIPDTLYFKTNRCLVITACGRGKHCRTNVDSTGFPRSYLPRQKTFFGFQTGEMVVANVPSGKHAGRYVGRVSCRSSGSFGITTSAGRVDGINHKYMKTIQHNDGYQYSEKVVAIYA